MAFDFTVALPAAMLFHIFNQLTYRLHIFATDKLVFSCHRLASFFAALIIMDYSARFDWHERINWTEWWNQIMFSSLIRNFGFNEQSVLSLYICMNSFSSKLNNYYRKNVELWPKSVFFIKIRASFQKNVNRGIIARV